ncbi:hypothetical protein [Enhygromyxa salina]|uniref:LTD domain-containing protein n=1 Tax=Enhygromyxa salina TaxID=215803 RepID=A0A2S9YY61_9BACT|nr:hypothetical protein [Enhygromyxa salina]PRQ09999.1 hypothetical protein ENSA7_02050 [Enhygromyxa salina]
MPPHRTIGRGRASTCLGLALLIGSASGCGRDPLPELCPDVDAGELVISELRGDQASDDSFGHYIEIYNDAGRGLDLQGLRVRLRSSGGEQLELFVRDPVELSAGGYAVIGPGLEDDVASWIDYGVAWDISGGTPDENTYPRDFMRYRSGFVELDACGSLIDQAFYETDVLTKTGTMACGNAENPPRASDNDDLSGGCWCVDDLGAEGQPLFGVGLPGSPGEANRCP